MTTVLRINRIDKFTRGKKQRVKVICVNIVQKISETKISQYVDHIKGFKFINNQRGKRDRETERKCKIMLRYYSMNYLFNTPLSYVRNVLPTQYDVIKFCDSDQKRWNNMLSSQRLQITENISRTAS